MKIVLLLGPSSAGKSTLCDALVKEHGWYTHGSDLAIDIIERERTPLLLEKLKVLGLIERLSFYLTEAAIIKLAAFGKFDIINGDISISHQFNSPDFLGLDTILSKAGFIGRELEDLTHLLHGVGDAFKSLPMPDMLDRMLDDVFQLPANASIIIDHVPPCSGDVKEMLHDFKEKLIERGHANLCTVEYATVLAFCPPKALSTRINRRNEAANISGDLKNKREGIFPFLQLSQLITAAETDDAVEEDNTLSKLQLLMIALKHLSPGVGEGETQKAKVIFRAGAHEYNGLRQRFFKLSGATNVTVFPRDDLETHAVIDLAAGASPSKLALELIDKTNDAPSLSISLLSHGACSI